MKLRKEKFTSDKELHSIIEKKNNNSTIEKKDVKHGNKVSMYEAVKGVDEETNKRENITLFTRDRTSPLQSDNFEYVGEINKALMIESEVTLNNKKLEK